MISELDIDRAANLVIKHHGVDAAIEAARMVERMMELGDLEGRDLWLLIWRTCCRRRPMEFGIERVVRAGSNSIDSKTHHKLL